MKKIYSIIALMFLFVGSAWGDNLIGDDQTITIGSSPVQNIANLIDGYYVMRVNPADQPRGCYVYPTDNNTYSYTTGSAPTKSYVVRITIKEDNSSNSSPNKKIAIQDYNCKYMYIASDVTSGNVGTTTNENDATSFTASDKSNNILLSLSTNNYVNLNGTPLHIAAGAAGGWSQYWFYPVTKVSTYNVTWNITYNDGQTKTITTKVASGAQASSNVPSFAYTNLNYTDQTINSDTEIDATATFNTPFTASTSFDAAKWYYVRSCDNNKKKPYLINNTTGEKITAGATTPTFGSDDSYKWAFIGNPIDGYQIINKAAGDGYYLYNNETPKGGGDDNTYPIMGSAETAQSQLWTLSATTGKALANSTNSTVNFAFRPSGSNYSSMYWNNRGDFLSYWSGGFDVGSCWYVDSVLTADAEVEANIKPYYDATGYFTLTDQAKQDLITAGYSSSKTEGYTAEQYNSMLAVVQNAENYKFPESGYYRIKSSGTSSQHSVGYIGFGSTLDGKGTGLKTVSTNYNTDASTVLYLDKNDDGKYTIGTQSLWATNATALNMPVLTTATKSEAGTFTMAPVTTNESYVGYATIEQENKVNNTYDFFHEAGWGTDKSCVCVWLANVTPSFWQIEPINDGDLVYSVDLHSGGDNYYATAYLPFPSKISTGGVKAYTAKLNDAKTYLTLKEIDGTIPANTGVVLVGSSAGTVQFTLSTENVNEIDNDLTGVTIATTIAASDNKLSLGINDDGVVGFYHWAGTLTNKAYYAYTDDETSPSKGFAFSFGDDDPTGISEDLIREAVKELQGQRYNVQGQPVGADYKGIVIQNGKKYLQK